MGKQCIVNFFSTGREDYKAGTERMLTSAIRNGFKGDILVFSPDFENDDLIETPIGSKVISIKGYPVTKEFGECKPHKEQPYMFKSYVIQYAKEQGYDEVLWCDSSTFICKNPEHYFELSREIGVVCFDNQGCLESTWTADDCLEQMGCSIEYARTFFEVEAFVMLFNFKHERAHKVFDDYIKYSSDGICLLGKSGSIRPDFTAHRHDQSILSYVLRKHYGLPINYGGWVINQDFFSGKWNPTFGKVGMLYQPFRNAQ